MVDLTGATGNEEMPEMKKHPAGMEWAMESDGETATQSGNSAVGGFWRGAVWGGSHLG